MTLAYKMCTTKKHLDIILYGYIFGSWYLSFIAYQVGRQYGDRLAGVYTVDAPDVNFVGAAIAPSLVLCLYFFWIKKNLFYRSLFVIAGAFIANALVLINSRGAYIAVALSIAYFMYHMFFSSFQRKYQKGTAIFILLAGLASLAVVMDRSSIERILSINENTRVQESQETAATRTVFWLAAWDMAKDYPLGTGYEGFSYYSNQYIPDHVNTGRSRNRAVHSTWFETLSEVGYLGLVLFVLMLFSSFKILKITKKHLKKQNMVDDYFKIFALEGTLLAFMVAMTFINRMRAEVLHWCILFACVAYSVYVLNNKDNNVNST
ncbi:O-antigen ligase family protein [Paraglaciecola arctica]|uniref:O-antigen ligase family protein n=1 Tax=Paraglaciecola arctica TaxID=1128911 RepID=UPI0020906781|nr:O-antigen ligase family protein [Paraglaciecola arctica]